MQKTKIRLVVSLCLCSFVCAICLSPKNPLKIGSVSAQNSTKKRRLNDWSKPDKDDPRARIEAEREGRGERSQVQVLGLIREAKWYCQVKCGGCHQSTNAAYSTDALLHLSLPSSSLPCRDYQPLRLAILPLSLSFRDVEEMLSMRGVTSAMRRSKNGALSSVRPTLTDCAVDLLNPATDGISTRYFLRSNVVDNI